MPTRPPPTKDFEQNQPSSETIFQDDTELQMQLHSSIKTSNTRFSKPFHQVVAELNCILHAALGGEREGVAVPNMFFSLWHKELNPSLNMGLHVYAGDWCSDS